MITVINTQNNNSYKIVDLSVHPLAPIQPTIPVTELKNVGDGIGVYSHITGTTAHLKTLVAGENITLIDNDDSITIASSDLINQITFDAYTANTQSIINNIENEFDSYTANTQSILNNIESEIENLKAVSGSSSSFYDGATPATVTVGGITSGTQLSGKTLSEIIEEMLVVYLEPAFSSFSVSGQATTVEAETELTGNRTFTWSINNSNNVLSNSIKIIDITDNNNELASALANDSSESVTIKTVTLAAGQTQQWRATAENTKNESFNSSTFTVTAIYPYFFGKSSSQTINSNLVTGGTKVVANSNSTITINFNSSPDDYIWFAIPATSTSKTAWYVNELNQGSIGGDGNLFGDETIVSVSTEKWSGVNYKVYISNYTTSINNNMQLRNS